MGHPLPHFRPHPRPPSDISVDYTLRRLPPGSAGYGRQSYSGGWWGTQGLADMTRHDCGGTSEKIK